MFQCGYTEGQAVDQDRPSWRTDELRPLAWAAWYPAPPNTETAEHRLGAPGRKIFTLGAVARDSEPDRTLDRWPVVVLSHGTGGTAEGLGWLGVRLARRGFLCIGVSHHGNTALETFLPEGFLCWWERARDLTVILDQLDTAGPLAERLDPGNVFAAGFSLGGYTVLSLAGAITEMSRFQDWLATQDDNTSGPREFPDLADHIPELLADSETFRNSLDRQSRSYRDPRIRAVAAFAPAPPVRAFDPSSVAEIGIPVSIMTGGEDIEAPFDQCTLWLQQQNPQFAVECLKPHVGHYVFLPEATARGLEVEPLLCRDGPGVDRRAIHDRAADMAEALFRGAFNTEA